MVEWTFETDQKIVHLVTLINDAFTSVRSVESLRDKFASLREPIASLLKQTAECCIFIRHYVGRNFVRESLSQSTISSG